MAEGDGDQRNKGKKGKGGNQNPLILVTGLEVGNVKSTGIGEFEVSLNVLLMNGKYPAHGAQYQFMVDGMSQGKPQLVNISGRVEGTLKLVGKKSVSVSLHIKWRDIDYRPFLKNIDLPEQVRNLLVFGTAKRENVLEIVFRRLGKNAKPEVGSISAWDWRIEDGKPEWMLLGWDIEDKEGFVSIKRPMLERPRKVTFFLTDDVDVKIDVEIPAKPAEIKSGEKLEEAIIVSTSSFERGRGLANKLFGKR